jgi:hypothetical protein
VSFADLANFNLNQIVELDNGKFMPLVSRSKCCNRQLRAENCVALNDAASDNPGSNPVQSSLRPGNPQPWNRGPDRTFTVQPQQSMANTRAMPAKKYSRSSVNRSTSMNLQFLGLPAISTRVIGLAAKRINGRTFEVKLCRGNPVERAFGVERLRIGQACIDIDRINSGGIPVLDSLREDSIAHSLGLLVHARVKDGALVGIIKFHETPDGKEAAELIEDDPDKLAVAVAYDTQAIEVYDANNALVNPNDTARANEPGIAFEVTEWQVCALGLLGSDQGAVGNQDRAYRGPVAPDVARVFERMATAHMAMAATSDHRLASREVKPEINVSIFNGQTSPRCLSATSARMAAAQTLIECSNDGWRDVVMPKPNMIFYGRRKRCDDGSPISTQVSRIRW